MTVKTTSPTAPYLVFGPMVVAQVAFIVYRGHLSWSQSAALACAGLALWTLVEYLLHRFAFHSTSEHPLAKPFNSTLHLWHHDTPTSLDYVAAPMSLAAPVFGILFGVFVLLSRRLDVASALGAGVACGYLAYEWIHFVAHLNHVRNPLLKFLKKYHLMHHFKDRANYFGVTSPFWDFVFGTKPAQRTVGSRSTLPKTNAL